MAVLTAKKRLFESVFSSQLSAPASNSSEATDQARWHRSWHAVTHALTLPTTAKKSGLIPFELVSPKRSPDRMFDEALKYVLDDEDRFPKTGKTPDIVLWYTNHVRHHYLNHAFPIIQRLQDSMSTHSTDPELCVDSCIQVLEGAYKLYYEGLDTLIQPIRDARRIVRNFRLNLTTIVSNSVPDREPIRLVVRKHVVGILDASEAEFDFLGLVKSLNDVGLGGEKYVSDLLFFSIT